MVGMMKPSAPMSPPFCMSDSMEFGIRIMGAPVMPFAKPGHAAIIFSMSAQVIVLCCISNQMKSQCFLASQYPSGSSREIVRLVTCF